MSGKEGDGANIIRRFFGRFSSDRYFLYTIILLALFAVFQLIRNIWMGVHLDEANWWMQTKHLSAGYFFHPPFVVYEQFVITRIFGSSPLALRLGSIFFTTGALYLVYVLVKEMFEDTRLAFYATLIFSLLPIIMYWTIIGFQDAPFLFFFLLSTLFVWRAIGSRVKGYWYAAGVSAGFLLLCKLESFLFFVGLLLFLAVSKDHRYWLKRKEPYLGFLIVVAMFTPTLIWYASRGFQPITYQITNRPGFLEFGLFAYIVDVLKHIGWEMAVLSFFVYPLSIFGLIYGGYLGFKEKDARFQLLFWISVAYLVFFTLTAGPPYWSFPGHTLSLIMAIGAFPILLSRTKRQWIKRLWRPAFVVLILFFALASSVYGLYHYTTASVLHNGWKELAQEVEEVREGMPGGENAVIAAPYYWIPSEIAYHEKYNPAGYSLAFRVYENNILCDDSTYTPWVPLDELVGKDFIFVDEKDNPDNFDTPVSYWEEKLPPYFEKVEEPIIFTVERKGKEFRTYYIFKCYGFKGPDPEMDPKGEIKEYAGET